MSWMPIAFGAVAIAVAIVFLWWVTAKRRAKPRLPYSRRRSLLTPSELRFYRSLLVAVPKGITVFVKVRLMDLVDVPDHAWQEYGAPASGMHVDFVLADSASMEPRMVIELDDRSHLREEVQKRDAFKNAALAAAGVGMLRIPVTVAYSAEELHIKIAAAVA